PASASSCSCHAMKVMSSWAEYTTESARGAYGAGSNAMDVQPVTRKHASAQGVKDPDTWVGRRRSRCPSFRTNAASQATIVQALPDQVEARRAAVAGSGRPAVHR